jgi:hypothetical protein
LGGSFKKYPPFLPYEFCKIPSRHKSNRINSKNRQGKLSLAIITGKVIGEFSLKCFNKIQGALGHILSFYKL